MNTVPEPLIRAQEYGPAITNFLDHPLSSPLPPGADLGYAESFPILTLRFQYGDDAVQLLLVCYLHGWKSGRQADISIVHDQEDACIHLLFTDANTINSWQALGV